ncbi:hypothetical protein GF386_01135 [Candidatus Pacearchaeota archaeon]|nr:hypothetical protein [Candidatus Pacearchaeota archaeon]MBD3282835.1 hypothetical protein [Candidatus Pacearchaeota archaeon]
MDKFDLEKKKQLDRQDRSNIGNWDLKIRSLCNKINRKRNYYTTSSCAGRIILMKYSDKKEENIFLYRTHNRISFKELKKALKEINYKDLIEFQQTSCILHVACRSLEDAQDIVDKAKFAGWKRSGIMSTRKRFMVELHSTESMSFPVKQERILVDDYYLKLIVKIANSKLERIWNKIKKLKEII